MRQAARVYFETQITTTSQGQVLIMLYDGAIKFLMQAKERIAAQDYAGKGKLISNAIDVVNELASSLNADKGGDLAANLSQLYFYCNKRLFMANSRMDIGIVDEVIKILGGLRSAYAQIIDTPEAVAAMAKVPAPTGNPVRSPAGTQAAPANAILMPKTKVHNAYATQGATTRTAPYQEPAAQAKDTQETETPVTSADDGKSAPVTEQMPDKKIAPLPPLDIGMEDAPPHPLGINKHLAASNLYRKFAH